MAGPTGSVVDMVLSSSRRMDRELMLGLYERVAVNEYWIDDPMEGLVEKQCRR